MSPSGYNSDEVAANLIIGLGSWVKPRRLGRVTASSAGFELPGRDMRSPDVSFVDVSFVKAERLPVSPEVFAPLAPDLAVEVKSPTDSLDKLREKPQGHRCADTARPASRLGDATRRAVGTGVWGELKSNLPFLISVMSFSKANLAVMAIYFLKLNRLPVVFRVKLLYRR